MREIKFRGLREDGKGWVYGFYVYRPDGKHQIYWKPFEHCTTNTYHYVDPDTVGQYTGSKDKHGTEIYEGDLLSGGMTQHPVTVSWGSDSNGFVACRKGDSAKWLLQSTGWLKVIGNIHEQDRGA